MRRLVTFEMVTDVMTIRSSETLKSAAIPEMNEALRLASNRATVTFFSATDALPQGFFTNHKHTALREDLMSSGWGGKVKKKLKVPKKDYDGTLPRWETRRIR